MIINYKFSKILTELSRIFFSKENKKVISAHLKLMNDKPQHVVVEFDNQKTINVNCCDEMFKK